MELLHFSSIRLTFSAVNTNEIIRYRSLCACLSFVLHTTWRRCFGVYLQGLDDVRSHVCILVWRPCDLQSGVAWSFPSGFFVPYHHPKWPIYMLHPFRFICLPKTFVIYLAQLSHTKSEFGNLDEFQNHKSFRICDSKTTVLPGKTTFQVSFGGNDRRAP